MQRIVFVILDFGLNETIEILYTLKLTLMVYYIVTQQEFGLIHGLYKIIKVESEITFS